MRASNLTLAGIGLALIVGVACYGCAAPAPEPQPVPASQRSSDTVPANCHFRETVCDKEYDA